MKTIFGLLVGINFATFFSTTAIASNASTERYGGEFKLAGKGSVVVFDCRSRSDFKQFAEGINAVKRKFNPETRLTTADGFTVESAHSKVIESGGTVGLFVINDAHLPMTLLASEEKWAMINEAKVVADKPKADTLKRRMSILFARQCFRLLGSDGTKSAECCLMPVSTLADLDSLQTFDISAWSEMSIKDSMPKIGIESIEIGTYQDACELGIAPPPTNEVQKSIWEKANNKKIDAKDPTARWKRDFPDKEKPKTK